MGLFSPCYMCSRRAVSMEHVPPKSFFPVGHRNSLITVPSCEIHNGGKSLDDEYLRLVFASLISGNEIARKKIWPKVLRSLEKAPLKHNLYKNLRPLNIGALQTGIFDADMPRFNKAMDAIRRVLYFHQKEIAWREDVSVFPPSREIVSTTDNKFTSLVQTIEAGTTQHIGNLPKIGANPEIFYYQYIENEQAGLMRQVYYEGIFVTVAFNPQRIRGLLPQLKKHSG